jgi:chromosome segregation ATPase
MSNTYIKAADDALRFLKGFAAIKEVADAFAEVGSLQQARTEAEAALPGLRAQADAARAELKQAQDDAQQVKDKAKKTTAEAKQVADGIVSAASSKADSVKAAADSYYETTVQATKQAEADAALRALADTATRAAIEVEVKDLEARAEKARAYLAKLQG